jgi:hypothetical protein
MKKAKLTKTMKANPATETKLSKAEIKQAALAQAKTQIKQEHEFFHDPDGVPWDRVFVNGHFENLPIRGQKFELLITKGLRELLGFMPKKSEVKEVLREFRRQRNLRWPGAHASSTHGCGWRFPSTSTYAMTNGT